MKPEYKTCQWDPWELFTGWNNQRREWITKKSKKTQNGKRSGMNWKDNITPNVDTAYRDNIYVWIRCLYNWNAVDSGWVSEFSNCSPCEKRRRKYCVYNSFVYTQRGK